MSYEYKESMKEDLQHLYEIPTGVWKYKEKLEELDEVYAQAAKADEYEAKAKAFDKYLETQQRKLDQIKRKVHTNDNFTYKDVSAFIAYNDTINELESYRK